MTFTDDQIKAIEDFKKFLDSDKQVFVLNGYAGTGKTTILRHIIENEIGDRAARLMAPTGRAALILSEKSGRMASTIHRSIFKIDGGPQLDVKKLRFFLLDNQDPLSTIYFVDEASMVSDLNQENEMFRFGSGNLFHDLMEYVGNRKIVFIGDNAQLPPVGQNFSPALDEEYLHSKYGLSVMGASMHEVVRQGANSGVLKNSIELRKGLEEDDFSTFVLSTDGFVHTSDSLLNDYSSITSNKVDKDAIVVVESNKLALRYNKDIRKLILGDSDQRLLIGDQIVVSQNNYTLNKELFNGMILSVAACGDESSIERRVVGFNSTERDAEGKSIVHTMELSFRDVTLEYSDGSLCKCKIFDSWLDSEETLIDLEVRQALHADFNYRHPNLKRGSDEYYNAFKKDPYVNAVFCKYGYAITCHKAQGGEWKKVFVDMEMMKGKQSRDFFRWSYTAITRSCENLWVANAPHFDFLSEMIIAPIAKMGVNGMEFYCPEKENFLDYRAGRVRSLCEESGLNFHEDRGKDYQHILNLTDGRGGNCMVQLWYNKVGYSGLDKIVSCTNEELRSVVEKICRESLIPEGEYYKPSCDRGQKLFDVVSALADQLGLTIVNVNEGKYVDRYFFVQGENYDCIDFSYNGKGNYSRCTPRSTQGASDKALEALCDLLR